MSGIHYNPSREYMKQCIQCKRVYPSSAFISERGTSMCLLCNKCRAGHRERQRSDSNLSIPHL